MWLLVVAMARERANSRSILCTCSMAKCWTVQLLWQILSTGNPLSIDQHGTPKGVPKEIALETMVLCLNWVHDSPNTTLKVKFTLW